MVLELKKQAPQCLKRRLSVGFNRATRLMDELEAAGVIGPAEGTTSQSLNDKAQLQKYNKNVSQKVNVFIAYVKLKLKQ